MNEEDRVTLDEIKKRLSVYHEPMQVWSRVDIAFLIALAEKQGEFIDWMQRFGEDYMDEEIPVDADVLQLAFAM